LVGLTQGKQVCVAAASYSSSSVSAFTSWACVTVPSATGQTVATTLPGSIPSLSCDGEVMSVAGGFAAISVAAGISNAGRLVRVEVYSSGQWFILGSSRVSATGLLVQQTSSRAINKKGTYPLRLTQGSRFICEGNLGVRRSLSLRGSLRPVG
jgi:hypothetical protein